MSKISNQAKAKRIYPTLASNAVINYMGGTSYTLNPLETLKMISASSIFGEPQYYRSNVSDEVNVINKLFSNYSLFSNINGKSTSQIMEEAIDDSLSYDFGATLDWAAFLRSCFYMRLNPQVIMVRAAIHKDREAFTAKNPGRFAEINYQVMSRADEPSSQLAYYVYSQDGISKIPNILKRSWQKKLEALTPYEIHKYKNSELGLIDVVRVCHANNALIDELMKTGTLNVSANEFTWENLRAGGKSWKDIFDTIDMGHMAILRNLRGMFTEVNDFAFCIKVLDKLKAGVLKGKQFPFRYYQARLAVLDCNEINHKNTIIKALDDCIDIATNNMPKLNGKTMCLSDNSGSAHSPINSSYGSTTVSTIGNLSSLITAYNSEDGYIGIFGDRLESIPVTKDVSLFSQLDKLAPIADNIGASTENGIWLFFRDAIEKQEVWDNIFIYSDQQAGHGGLYGLDKNSYAKYIVNNNYIDVAKLIDIYRKTVNPNVNVYVVQTAGYDNVLVPESGYRTTLLYGWTGNELVYADTINKFWDEFDKTHNL